LSGKWGPLYSEYRKNKDYDRFFETGDFLPVSKNGRSATAKNKCACVFKH